jgi:cytochrome c-type biogenesis protein CcmH/NrfG
METIFKYRYCFVLASSLVTFLGTGQVALAQSTGRTIAYNQPLSSYSVNYNNEIRVRAQSSYQSSQFTFARTLYQQICTSQEANANDFYWLGESCAHCQDYAAAAKAFADGLRLDPTNDKLNVRYAESLFSSHNREAAASSCQAAISNVKSDWAKQKLRVLASICSKSEPQMDLSRSSLTTPRALTER